MNGYLSNGGIISKSKGSNVIDLLCIELIRVILSLVDLKLHRFVNNLVRLTKYSLLSLLFLIKT